MVMTYNSLLAQVAAYLNRSDPDTLAQIPNFVYQCEQKLARLCENLGLEAYVVSAFVPRVSVYQKPARWRRSIAMNYGAYDASVPPVPNIRTSIDLVDYDYARMYWPNSTLTGSPKYYADYGFNNFLVVPTPDAAYPYEYSFLELPEPLSVANQTNWYTNYIPETLLYGTLLEAIGYLKNDDRIPVWTQYFNEGVQSINKQNNERISDRGDNRRADLG